MAQDTKDNERLKKKKLALKLAGRKAVNESYLKYVEIVNTSVNKDADWKRGKHLVYICNQIQEFIEKDTGNAYDIMILSVPPQTGKSTSVTEALPAWYLGKNPDKSAIVLAYGDDLSQRFGRRNKEKIENFGKIFFDISISKTKSANDDFEIEGHKGRMITRGIMAGVTGNAANLLLIDDPVRTREEAYSAVTREKIWQEWMSSAKTRLAGGAKVIIIMTRWHCMVDNTPILCYNKIKSISDVKVGDVVLTTNGYEAVEAINIIPPEDENKEIIEIKPYYFAEPIQCTKEHRILTQRGYVEAKDLEPLNDYVVFPQISNKAFNDDEMQQLIPSLKKKQFQHTTRLTGSKNRIDREVLKSLLDDGKTYAEIAKILGYKYKQTIGDYVTLYGLNTTQNNKIDRNVVHDNDFWWFVGLWLAEGTVTYGRKTLNVVRLTLSHEELSLAERVKDCFKRYGIPVSIRHEPNKSVTTVSFSSEQIATFLLDNFGHGSHSKEIPSIVNKLPDEKFFYFLHGYWQGDGCYCEKHGYRFATVSRGIVSGLQSALLMRGYFASSFRNSAPKKVSYINGKPIKSGESYELRVNDVLPYPFTHIDGDPPKRKFAYSDKNNFYFKIKKTTEKIYGGFLYDLQTPTHNFVTTSGTVHNCDDLAGRILATEKNVIHINIPCEAEDNDVLGRKKGEGLFPEIGKGTAWKDQMKASYIAGEGLDAWNAMYQGRPSVQGGNIFKRDWFKFYDDAPTMYQTIISVDAAFKDTKTSDFVAIGVWGKNGANVYLMDLINERMDFVRTLEVIRLMKGKYKESNMVLIEDKANGSAIISTLRQEIMGIVPVEPLGSKESRAYAIQPFVMAGNVNLPKNAPWVEDYLDQMMRFPKSSKDDMVDMTTQALVRLKDFVAEGASPQKPKPDFTILQPPKSIISQLTNIKISKGFMNY